MNIDKETLQKIAHLARLELSEKTQTEMETSLNTVLSWMEELNEVDTSQVLPLLHMSRELNAWREDVAISTITREEGLKNAPSKNQTYFKVPKVKE
ncbi:MAG: Asp-tRNA(Asn)/Glu-tRNA(Gln) amidotransferase subunit GatC [Pseudarcicella sp.]|nr:Asp-tRNA(Asn)/Glu-tRNA(Gln) amidotransferase subunit GatC [Pseudarcicella sp.]MBP6410868.1 Asp-tRNA(Asn)/Glu-tRNA(Gln) amidotransferase subunit GatC [Pseudarcicella sp.]